MFKSPQLKNLHANLLQMFSSEKATRIPQQPVQHLSLMQAHTTLVFYRSQLREDPFKPALLILKNHFTKVQAFQAQGTPQHVEARLERTPFWASSGMFPTQEVQQLTSRVICIKRQLLWTEHRKVIKEYSARDQQHPIEQIP